MHVIPTDFRDLGKGCEEHWTKAILATEELSTLISKPTKKVANRLLGFPSSVHIVGWRVSLFAQTSLEIVPLINRMRAKKVSLETIVNSTCSLFN